MIGVLIGTAAKAAVTGAAGLAAIGVLKDSKVGDALREAVVTVTEVGVRGYKLVEAGVEMVTDVATDVFTEAKTRADAKEDATSDDNGDDAVKAAEAVVADAASSAPEDFK